MKVAFVSLAVSCLALPYQGLWSWGGGDAHKTVFKDGHSTLLPPGDQVTWAGRQSVEQPRHRAKAGPAPSSVLASRR